MSNKVEYIDPKLFSVTEKKSGMAHLAINAVYSYKGQMVGFLISEVQVETGDEFNDLSYQNAKDAFKHGLEMYLFTEDFISKCPTLQSNAETFKNYSGLTFVEALKSGDLSVSVTKLDILGTSSFLKITKKEEQNAN